MSKRLVAMVLGSAAGWLDDVAKVRALVEPDVIVAVNLAAVNWPGEVHHMATMHPELLPRWLTERSALGFVRPREFWVPKGRPCPHIDGITFRTVDSWGGSSGLLAVTVALDGLGASHVICAGVPLQKNAAHFHDKRPWHDARRYWPAWERRLPHLRERVKSASGWTAGLLGEPTAEWLGGD